MTLKTLQAEVVDNDCSSELLEINREIAMMDEIIPILNARVKFVNAMKRRKSPIHLQILAPKIPPPKAEILQVCDSNSACGLLMYDEEALGIFILPCKHAYHIYCFANLAGREGKYLAASCGHVIPDNIKESMFIDSGGDTSTRCLKFGGARGDQNERLDAENESESAKEKDFVVVAGDTSALKKGFAHKVRTRKELVLVIRSLAIFPPVQSDEYPDSGVVPQEAFVGLGANDDAGGDAPGRKGTASGWTQWKDVRMPFPIGMHADPLMKDMPPLIHLSWKVLVLNMNRVLLRRYPYPDILDQQISKFYFSRTVYKGGGDCGTLCITRPDVCGFLCECVDIFHLCIWSSRTNRNMQATLKGCLFGLHPRI
ncbi:hypothetical protein L7F22_032691 [Adiantum nelumboides]|nr:hypothetical protein [Adiantum nelumboides]